MFVVLTRVQEQRNCVPAIWSSNMGVKSEVLPIRHSVKENNGHEESQVVLVFGVDTLRVITSLL